MSLREIFQEILNRVKPEEQYLSTENFSPSDVLGKVVENCLTIEEPKKFKVCIVKILDKEFNTFDKAVNKCYSIYRKNKNFDEFVSCVIDEVSKKGSQLTNLINYCKSSLKSQSLKDLYDCVYSGLEVINEVTNKTIKELSKKK